MIVVPRNRIDMAFPMRLMFVLPAICPREVETRLFYKDKLVFTFIAMVEYLLLNIKLFFHASIG